MFRIFFRFTARLWWIHKKQAARGRKQNYLLWTLYFLREYSAENRISSIWSCDDRKIRKIVINSVGNNSIFTPSRFTDWGTASFTVIFYAVAENASFFLFTRNRLIQKTMVVHRLASFPKRNKLSMRQTLELMIWLYFYFNCLVSNFKVVIYGTRMVYPLMKDCLWRRNKYFSANRGVNKAFYPQLQHILTDDGKFIREFCYHHKRFSSPCTLREY